jgi:hypothetical protein
MRFPARTSFLRSNALRIGVFLGSLNERAASQPMAENTPLRAHVRGVLLRLVQRLRDGVR